MSASANAAHDVTVALVGHAPDAWETMLPDSEFGLPYEARAKTTFSVDHQTTLAEIRLTAIQRLGIQTPRYWDPMRGPAYGPVCFFKDGDEEGFASRALPRRFWPELTIVDVRGRAIFGVHDHRSVTFDDLRRTADAGALDGDPHRPYLFAEGGWGDQPPPDWPTILIGLDVVMDYLSYGVNVAAAWILGGAAIRRFRDRLQRGSEAAHSNTHWAQKGWYPYQFQALLRTQRWSSDQVARLLDCSQDEAEAILWVLGFTYDDEADTWAEVDTPEPRLLRMIFRQIEVVSDSHPDVDRDSLLRERLAYILTHGDEPPLPIEEALPHDLSLPSTDQLLGAQGFFSRRNVRKLVEPLRRRRR